MEGLASHEAIAADGRLSRLRQKIKA